MDFAIAMLSGMSMKLYDDLNDNDMLEPFKNDFIMEYLKGFHYITFTATAISNPLFFYVNYAANILHCLTNQDGYACVYEHSVMYSFALLFVILYFKKQSHVGFYDYVLLLNLCGGCFIEPILANFLLDGAEFSYNKLYIRMFGVLYLGAHILLSTSRVTKCAFYYLMGYFIISVASQYYSVTMRETNDSIEKQLQLLRKIIQTKKIGIINKNNFGAKILSI